MKIHGLRKRLTGGAKAHFLASKHFSFAKGDSIEVTGSKMSMGGGDYVIAR